MSIEELDNNREKILNDIKIQLGVLSKFVLSSLIRESDLGEFSFTKISYIFKETINTAKDFKNFPIEKLPYELLQKLYIQAHLSKTALKIS